MDVISSRGVKMTPCVFFYWGSLVVAVGLPKNRQRLQEMFAINHRDKQCSSLLFFEKTDMLMRVFCNLWQSQARCFYRFFLQSFCWAWLTSCLRMLQIYLTGMRELVILNIFSKRKVVRCKYFTKCWTTPSRKSIFQREIKNVHVLVVHPRCQLDVW